MKTFSDGYQTIVCTNLAKASKAKECFSIVLPVKKSSLCTRNQTRRTDLFTSACWAHQRAWSRLCSYYLQNAVIWNTSQNDLRWKRFHFSFNFIPSWSRPLFFTKLCPNFFFFFYEISLNTQKLRGNMMIEGKKIFFPNFFPTLQKIPKTQNVQSQ